ncbi:hypothetical protein [Alteribacillus iranensis]|uniref:DUF8042 domain-containing protein n=1 Tax=Alteribacillus iranensis TaxID=930128 RepID=A0A1I2B7H9_9BACI|nr:hypothetical protein [Alteribacillus iranensis]SFE52152.1 hypothetical protein SAMN05192532_102134 [Alteribacillus iranensis]
MEKHIHVMKQSVELTDTMIEGLQHIQSLFSEGKMESTMFLFEDIVTAFSSVEGAIQPVMEELSQQDLDNHLQRVRNALEVTVTAYERKQYGKVQEIIQFTLLPQTTSLQQNLETAFQPYILS